jgi:hypothetical protein
MSKTRKTTRLLAALLALALLTGSALASPFTEDDAADLAENTAGDLTLEELAFASLAEEDIPEMIPLDAITEEEHVNRLYEQEEDLNSVVFQNRDGGKTAYYFPYAVKYVDQSGNTRDKRNKVTDQIVNPKYQQDFAFVNAENDINTYFPKMLNQRRVWTNGMT